jgi:hypothetical protein
VDIGMLSRCVHLRDRQCVLGLCNKFPALTCCNRCPKYDGPSRGLGDVVAKVAKVTGADRVVKAVTGGDCGCGKRRAKLNRAVPFREGAD